VIGVETRVEGERRESMSEEEDEINVTSLGKVLVLISEIPNCCNLVDYNDIHRETILNHNTHILMKEESNWEG
jgi:hypothetical protein